jgi:hypothetical protein
MLIHGIDGATLQLPAGSNMERVLLAQYVDFVPQVRFRACLCIVLPPVLYYGPIRRVVGL